VSGSVTRPDGTTISKEKTTTTTSK
jgi:hypothetical protein